MREEEPDAPEQLLLSPRLISARSECGREEGLRRSFSAKEETAAGTRRTQARDRTPAARQPDDLRNLDSISGKAPATHMVTTEKLNAELRRVQDECDKRLALKDACLARMRAEFKYLARHRDGHRNRGDGGGPRRHASVRSRKCYDGAACQRLRHGFCNFQHTPVEVTAARQHADGKREAEGARCAHPSTTERGLGNVKQIYAYTASHSKKAVSATKEERTVRQLQLQYGPAKPRSRAVFNRIEAVVNKSVREAFMSSFYDNNGEQQKYMQWMLNQDIKNKVIQLMVVKIPVNTVMKLTKKSTEDFSSMRDSRIVGANEKPSAPLQQVCAYATWSSSHKVSNQSNEMPAAACSPAAFVNKTTSSESQSKSETEKEHPRVEKKAKAKPAGGAKQRRAARRAAAATAAAAVAAEKRCAATQMQQGSSVHVVSREVEPEQSVPIAQSAAEMIDDEKVETKTENTETVTEEKAIKTQVSAEKLIDVSVEKNMEDVVSETRVKRRVQDVESDSEDEGNIKQECTNERSGIGTQCAQGSPSHIHMLRQKALQMNQNEMDVERLTSDRHEDQRIEVGSQRGGALHSAGNRIKSSAFAKGNKMRMEDG